MKIAKWSALFGIFLLCFLFTFQHINWETGEVYPPFQPTPTPTPRNCVTSSHLDCELTLIDELSMRLWEADGSPEDAAQDWYGDLFAANAFGCDMEYVEFFDLVMDTAQRFKGEGLNHQVLHLRILDYLRFKEAPCEHHLSDLSKFIQFIKDY